MEPTSTILIVDDDRDIRTLLADYLESNSYRALCAADGLAMWKMLDEAKPDLVVLDLNLPGDDGLTLCRKLRAQSTLPVIMLTARGEPLDRILGLEMGADDYLPKPFEPRELLARIRSVLRRSNAMPSGSGADKAQQMRFSNWTLDLTARHLLNPDGIVIMLSGAEFRLLKVFLEHPNRVLNRDQLLNLTQGRDADPFDRSIDIQISRLRQKLGEDARVPQIIKTVRNGGYVLAGQVTVEPHPLKAFLGSMTGRVFTVLLLGIIASAALTQWLAVGERTRAFERYRDFHAMERAEQLISTAEALTEPSRATYLRMATRGTILLQRPDQPLAETTGPTEFSTRLQQRLGQGIQLMPLRERPAACYQPRQSYIFAPSQWGGACEAMRVRLRDGELLKLSILPPPEKPATEYSEMLALLPFLFSVAVLAYLVTRMTMRPLKLLAQAAKDLGNDINHPPVVLSGAAEIRQASAAFNAMQARIRQHIMQRTQMLAAITHDLQTPLTRLRLRLEKVDNPDLQQRLIDDLSAMQQMVKEGLDLARSMDTTETMQALDLDSLLDSVCSDATDSGQPVALSGRAGMALMGRPMAIRRCLVNLIDNAVKYGHHANVTVERLAGAARIRIRDGGPGIADDQMARVFEPFYRIETSRSRESGGTGLGLTIARNIAEQHGANVVLANHADGGLEVTLVVPEYYAAR